MSAGRRQPPPIPSGPTPTAERQWKLLLDLWRWCLNGFSGLPATHEKTHLVGGSDALDAPGTPTTITLANAAVAPTTGVGPSYARGDHSHGTPKRDIRVKAAAADVGTRNALNFSAAFTVTDNPGSDRVDVDVAGLSPVDLEFLSWTL